jgi:16S rRNA (guanine1207-N2)-methyltransferase
MSETDTAKAIFVPFAAGEIPVPGAGARVLLLNACVAEDMGMLADCAVTAQQDFRPFARGLENRGAVVETALDGDGGYDVVMVRARKQKDENRALLAAALKRLAKGGTMVVAGANDAGGKRLSQEMAALGVKLNEISKHHCRILFGSVNGFDGAAVDTALVAAAPRVIDIAAVDTWTQPGLFGWDRLDPGTYFLLLHLPRDFRGNGADLGCGTGIISRFMLETNPGIKNILCVDADARAIDMTRRNITDARMAAVWRAVGQEEIPAKALDWVVMNPPFHEGALTASSVGVAFIRVAADLLRARGTLWMVANAHLPYEEHLAAAFTNITKIAEGDGYKVYKAVK